MDSFTIGQRVVVVSDPRLYGWAGTVAGDYGDGDGAWVEMDDELPDDLRVYRDGPRRNWLACWPHECEPEAEAATAAMPVRDLSPGQLLVGRDG